MMMDKKKMMKIAVGDGSGMQPVEIPPEVGRLPYLRSSTLPSLIYLRILWNLTQFDQYKVSLTLSGL